MSDLFIGELLVALLLVPVLFRPLFRRLQSVNGIPVLPALALLSCFAIIAGSGLRLSFLPFFIFTLVVFFANLGRLVRMSLGLPTDWFSPLPVVLDCVLLVALILTIAVSWQNRPELSWMPKNEASVSIVGENLPSGVKARYTISRPAEKGELKVVALAGTALSGTGSRPSLVALLVQEGWTVVEASYSNSHDFSNALYSSPFLRQTLVTAGYAFSGKPFLADEKEIAFAAGQQLSRLVLFAHQEFGAYEDVFLVTEGATSFAAVPFLAGSEGSVSGVACLVSDSAAAAVSGSLSVSADLSGIMPGGAGSRSIFVLKGEPSALFGYGELCGDDVLAARLLGGSRDAGRKTAELSARRVATWLEMRRTFNENK